MSKASHETKIVPGSGDWRALAKKLSTSTFLRLKVGDQSPHHAFRGWVNLLLDAPGLDFHLTRNPLSHQPTASLTWLGEQYWSEHTYASDTVDVLLRIVMEHAPAVFRTDSTLTASERRKMAHYWVHSQKISAIKWLRTGITPQFGLKDAVEYINAYWAKLEAL